MDRYVIMPDPIHLLLRFDRDNSKSFRGLELPADSFAFSPLAKGKNRGVAGALPGEQQSTGLLRLDLSNLPQHKKRTKTVWSWFFFGAASQIRTGDLILTKDPRCWMNKWQTSKNPKSPEMAITFLIRPNGNTSPGKAVLT